MGAREDALLRFRDACQHDPSVVAAFVGGSTAAHTDDKVSDVDLYAVTLETDYGQFFTRCGAPSTGSRLATPASHRFAVV